MTTAGRVIGTSHGPVAARSPWGLVIGAVMFVAAIVMVFWFHQTQAPSIGGPFELINARNGQPVSDLDFRGKWLLVFFGYTHCPDQCPTTLNNIGQAMVNLGPLADQVQPLFITIDPARDTLQVLVDFTAAFDPRIVGLSGSPDRIAAAAKAYSVYYSKRVIGDDYFLDHTASVHVMKPDGSYATSFLSTATSSDMTKRLRYLIESRKD